MRIFENKDCMVGMQEYPDKYFDLAIVDPPYGIGDINQNASRNIHKKIVWNNNVPDEKYFNELKRVSENQIIWGINYYGDVLTVNGGRIIHNKIANTGKQLKELSDADIASHSFGVNVKMFSYGWRGNVQGDIINWKNIGPDRRIHPTQKPIMLYKWLLQNYAQEGDLILDTHVGSASSLIACIELGFDYVGYELDQDYFKAAQERIGRFENQGNLFRQPAQNVNEQKQLFSYEILPTDSF